MEAWNGTIDDMQVALTSINGAVALFGVFFENPSMGSLNHYVGHGGNCAYEFAQLNGAAFTKYVATIKPSIVTINLGANDTSVPRASTQFEADLLLIVQRIQAADPDIAVILQIPTILGNMAIYATAYANVAVATGTTLYYWQDALGAWPANLLPDNTHPDLNGCQLLAADLTRVFGAPDGPLASQLFPWQSLDYAQNLIASPENDSTFTAATTNWIGSNGGSVILNAGSLTVTSVAAGSGGRLENTFFGGMLTIGQLYMLEYDLLTPPASGFVTVYYYSTVANTLPRQWPSGLATPDVGTTGRQHIMFRPTSQTSAFRFWLQNAGQSMTITNVSLKPMREIPLSLT